MIIFDLDQTLVDTNTVERLRKARQWKAVMARVASLPVYPGISELIGKLDSMGQVMAIVTKSPDMVAKSFVQQHGWPIKIVVGYHQAPRKPAPDGLLLAMRQGQATPAETIHVGDHPDDTAASKAAGIISIGAAWGLSNATDLAASQPDLMAGTVEEARRYLLALLSG